MTATAQIKFRYASLGLALLAVPLVFAYGLLGAVLGGMVVYSTSHWMAGALGRRMDSLLARKLAVLVFSAAITGLVVWGVLALISFLEGGGLAGVVSRAAHVLEQIRPLLPEWMTHRLPSRVDSIGAMLAEQMREQGTQAQAIALGQGLLHEVGRLVLGMVIGGMAAVSSEGQAARTGPLAAELKARMVNFALAFNQIVGAQARIALINAVLTGLFLLVALPLSGHPIPFAKTLVIITLIAGMIPVLGNLVSNTAITLVALSVSPGMAAACLGYLVVIHKLEYFLNARIIGGRIAARAWELLVAMLVMEALFGLPGIIGAPVFYAWVKRELRELSMI